MIMVRFELGSGIGDRNEWKSMRCPCEDRNTYYVRVCGCVCQPIPSAIMIHQIKTFPGWALHWKWSRKQLKPNSWLRIIITLLFGLESLRSNGRFVVWFFFLNYLLKIFIKKYLIAMFNWHNNQYSIYCVLH